MRKLAQVLFLASSLSIALAGCTKVEALGGEATNGAVTASGGTATSASTSRTGDTTAIAEGGNARTGDVTNVAEGGTGFGGEGGQSSISNSNANSSASSGGLAGGGATLPTCIENPGVFPCILNGEIVHTYGALKQFAYRNPDDVFPFTVTVNRVMNVTDEEHYRPEENLTVQVTEDAINANGGLIIIFGSGNTPNDDTHETVSFTYDLGDNEYVDIDCALREDGTYRCVNAQSRRLVRVPTLVETAIELLRRSAAQLLVDPTLDDVEAVDKKVYRFAGDEKG